MDRPAAAHPGRVLFLVMVVCEGSLISGGRRAHVEQNIEREHVQSIVATTYSSFGQDVLTFHSSATFRNGAVTILALKELGILVELPSEV